MNILVKVPSLGRPKQLIEAISKSMALAGNLDKITYQLTLDTNDIRTNNVEFDKVVDKLREHVKIDVFRKTSTGKIDACNRDMSLVVDDWDILVLLSDDMVCDVDNWDNILRSEMAEHFPDTDGVLWHNDGYLGERLNTLCILGKKYFERFGYIYHPEYKSLWCDNQFMEVANILNRQVYYPQILFKHEHPANNGSVANDDLYRINEAYFTRDKKVYEKQKSINFGLTPEYIEKNKL